MTVRYIAAFVLVTSLCFPRVCKAQEKPPWWTTRGVVDGGAVDDSTVATQGQLKHATQKAADELNSWMPGAAGPVLNGLVDDWVEQYSVGGYGPGNLLPADYHAMTVGQLKWTASKLSARLLLAGYWTENPAWLAANPKDIELANLGQLKTIINFNIAELVLSTDMNLYDFDGDGLTSLQEKILGLDPLISDGWVDSDGDGIHDRLEIHWYGDLVTMEGGEEETNNNGILDIFEIEAGNDPTLDLTGNTESRSNYFYDSMGRLTGVNETSYTFDIEGNLESSN